MSLYMYHLLSFVLKFPVFLLPGPYLPLSESLYNPTLGYIYFFLHKVDSWVHYPNPPIGRISFNIDFRTTPVWA